MARKLPLNAIFYGIVFALFFYWLTTSIEFAVGVGLLTILFFMGKLGKVGK